MFRCQVRTEYQHLNGKKKVTEQNTSNKSVILSHLQPENSIDSYILSCKIIHFHIFQSFFQKD